MARDRERRKSAGADRRRTPKKKVSLLTQDSIDSGEDKIDVMARGKVRRAKLYYLRELSGKAARIEEETATK